MFGKIRRISWFMFRFSFTFKFCIYVAYYAKRCQYSHSLMMFASNKVINNYYCIVYYFSLRIGIIGPWTLEIFLILFNIVDLLNLKRKENRLNATKKKLLYRVFVRSITWRYQVEDAQINIQNPGALIAKQV